MTKVEIPLELRVEILEQCLTDANNMIYSLLIRMNNIDKLTTKQMLTKIEDNIDKLWQKKAGRNKQCQ